MLETSLQIFRPEKLRQVMPRALIWPFLFVESARAHSSFLSARL